MYFHCWWSSSLFKIWVSLSISESTVTSYMNQFCCNFIYTWQFVFLHLLYTSVPNRSLTPCTVRKTEVLLPLIRNTVGIFKQITLLIIYKSSSKLVPILKLINDSIPSSNNPTVSFRFINCTLQIFPLSEMFSLVQIMFTLICLGSSNHCNSACFWARNFSNHQIMVYAPSVHISLTSLV
jgi:hypothetical protein